ncbi:spore photoproduct lyase [Ruminococcus sp. OA3]|uniref:SPL family radical SAM protein n=1 Tax=Ruminococcus sp. OA3 TaxID=2914164 RepID=UPI001F060820|nr:spore photoproduct lyase [Ruminococcus sp. OA3]MCH1983360.1 spore photoproduct lyase [Ruminococcus sp. OA3]
MKFDAVYYEKDSLSYPLGRQLREQFAGLPWISVESHNSIKEMQEKENAEFGKMKRNLIIGIRKTHRYAENHKVSDYLVPYTSSGCTAMCLYCYLVCNYNKCAYLRLFVNREQMLDRLIKKGKSSENSLTFEIGSNSDLVLENIITGNLLYTIPRFAEEGRGCLTFPTKFHMVDSLLDLPHKGKVIFRMSVNPQPLISRIELGTSSLQKRMDAVNKMCEAGYPCGLLIAPIMLVKGWKAMYTELFEQLREGLTAKTQKQMFLEIIMMTYSYVHRAINSEAFPNAPDLYDSQLMTGRGRGRYCYRPEARAEAEEFLRAEADRILGDVKILYIS